MANQDFPMPAPFGFTPRCWELLGSIHRRVGETVWDVTADVSLRADADSVEYGPTRYAVTFRTRRHGIHVVEAPSIEAALAALAREVGADG